jgi:hypothetical protein
MPASRFASDSCSLACRPELADNKLVKDTLDAINRMQADGIIGRYAIGGAVGATFYLEPAATVDLDVFVTLPTVSGGLLLSLSPIYDYLKSCGGKVEDEYIVIGGWLSSAQWRPGRGSCCHGGGGRPYLGDVRRASGRHRAASRPSKRAQPDSAVCRTGRGKSRKLQNILDRCGLVLKWSQFERKYLDGTK